jgi:hypothetical protein
MHGLAIALLISIYACYPFFENSFLFVEGEFHRLLRLMYHILMYLQHCICDVLSMV